MAVKNHLHSSSGVREVVSGTLTTFTYQVPYVPKKVYTTVTL
jgi:hypothetical protein